MINKNIIYIIGIIIFEPEAEQQPQTTEVARLFATKNQYCRSAYEYAKQTDNIFNYSFDDMQQNEEIYKYGYNDGAFPDYDAFVALQSLNSGCYFKYIDMVLNFRSCTYDLQFQNPTGCENLFQQYPLLYNKHINILTDDFKQFSRDRKINAFQTIIEQNRVYLNKQIRSAINFTDNQSCTVILQKNTRGDYLENTCICPGLIELPLETSQEEKKQENSNSLPDMAGTLPT